MSIRMLLDAAVILPGDIYERLFVNWENLSAYGANGRVRNTNVHSHIIAILTVCINVNE